MKHRISTTVIALAAALTLGACSGGEQKMEDSGAAQMGAGTTPAGGPNTNDTSAARPGGTTGTGTAAAGTGTPTDTTRRDTTRAGSGTPRTTP